MPLIKYDPFADLRRAERDLDNLWGQFPSFAETAPMDMYEENGKLITKVTLPNFKKDEIKVTANEGMLEVAAEHKEREEDKAKRHYYLRESSNTYLRRVTLPENADSDKIEANYKDGTLTVTMPSLEPKEAKPIEIK